MDALKTYPILPVKLEANVKPSWFTRLFARICAYLSQHKVRGNCPRCGQPVFRYHVSVVIVPKIVRSTTYIKCVNEKCRKFNSLPFAVKKERREFSRFHWFFFQTVQRHYPNNFFTEEFSEAKKK